jgi:hypothetical protein
MDARIAELVARLTALERERAEIVAEIDTLQSARSGKTTAIRVVPSAIAGDPIDRNSAIEEKIALFRRLFRGRTRVLRARRSATRKSGSIAVNACRMIAGPVADCNAGCHSRRAN